MDKIIEFYLKTSIYTNYEPYEEYYRSLPDNMEELTSLIMAQTIHRKELRRSRTEFLTTGKSHDHISEEYPWWKYISHDDILLTAPAITAELFRQDKRGFIKNREIKDKIVITCRYVAVLIASILKAKRIPCRVRSGFASYFRTDGKYVDHWIIEYYDKKQGKWIICDPDPKSGETHINMNKKDFGWIAKIWLEDKRGFIKNREIKDKIVITCRYVAVLIASILKAKRIPCRVRSGFASYFRTDGKYVDHWIIEYYDKKQGKWIICDPDPKSGETHINMNKKDFGWIAKIWLDVRSGKEDINKFIHGSASQGLNILAYTLFFDFHALMNDEISYLFMPSYIDDDSEFFNLTTKELKELDDLATLMLEPDKNFDTLRYIFFTEKKFRILNTPLISDKEHIEFDIN